METISDAAIWAEVLAGEPDGMGVIWDRHRDRVFRHLRGAGAGTTEAEDLTAVTFLELWRRRTAVRFVDDSLLPWLLVTASNVARNATRSQRRYQAFLARLPKPESTDGPEAEPSSQRGEALARSWPSVGRLDRQLLMLTAVEGFSVAEAAEVLGLTEAAAKMRLSRTRKRLHTSIDDQLLAEGELA
ncbi:MAG: sigma-70 family RNA polymerase sigma factor [Actinobacteria bacterium HGW-Actinobacteria-2]|nr:MAG: sigma-70 family RNA polymerase sigma factor [Actinobacteria bacterium HGW-Actinobacteria-2]